MSVFRVMLAKYFNHANANRGLNATARQAPKPADRCKGATMDSILQGEQNQPKFIGGRQVATLRNYGALCDIRRRNSGFLYHPHRVAISEELLETLADNVVLQFTNLDSRDVWTCTVRDFRHNSQPIQFGSFEPQRACEIERMNHTRQGVSKRKRVNELVHVDAVPAWKQEAFQGVL